MNPKSQVTIDSQLRKGRTISTPLLVAFIIIILVGSFVFSYLILDKVVNPMGPDCRPDDGWYSNTCPEESGMFPERMTSNAFTALPISLFVSLLIVFFVLKVSDDSSTSSNFGVLKSSLMMILYVILGSIIFINIVGAIGSLLT